MNLNCHSCCTSIVRKRRGNHKQTNTPYHSICNGSVEHFNGTLKKMVRRFCNEQPHQCHRFVNLLLFAYREAPQEATGFSPFQLLYGRTLCGPLQLLKELCMGETDRTETKTNYWYVFEFRKLLDNTMKIAQEKLLKS